MVARLHFIGVVVESKNVFFINMMLPDLHLHIHTLNSNNVRILVIIIYKTGTLHDIVQLLDSCSLCVARSMTN